MRTYDYAGPEPEPVRSHPWTTATDDPAARYHDLKANPALIRTSLEDFLPWSDWPAVTTFYELLEWLNGSESTLESNDCAFLGPAANTSSDFPKAFEVTGRLMVLWRELPMNITRSNIEWLQAGIHRFLNETDPDFEFGAVGIAVWRVRFVTLPVSEERRVGFQLMLSFWSWGDSKEEVMSNLARTIQNLWDALRAVAGEGQDAVGGDTHSA